MHSSEMAPQSDVTYPSKRQLSRRVSSSIQEFAHEGTPLTALSAPRVRGGAP